MAKQHDYKGPESYFSNWQYVVDELGKLDEIIRKIILKNPDIDFVWRGQKDSSWGIQSSLYREYKKAVNKYPTESELVIVERKIVQEYRKRWRADNISALQILADLQHHGAPTRLLDVTLNPYIAAWFAVEQEKDEYGNSFNKDSRIFALARSGLNTNEDTLAKINNIYSHVGDYNLFWHEKDFDAQKEEWGTGKGRKIWVPPAYNPRISAQNAAFLLDGIPLAHKSVGSSFVFRSQPKNDYLPIDEILDIGSIYMKLNKAENKFSQIKPNKKNIASGYTILIKSDVRKEIKNYLEKLYGYSKHFMYPDIYGASENIKSDIGNLIKYSL